MALVRSVKRKKQEPTLLCIEGFLELGLEVGGLKCASAGAKNGDTLGEKRVTVNRVKALVINRLLIMQLPCQTQKKLPVRWNLNFISNKKL